MVENNLEHFRVFYIVAQSKSLTQAAKSLAITQPAVSQAIKLLEDNLNTKLFVRNAKGVELTREGSLLYSYIEKGYEQFLLGEQAIKQMLSLDMGEIKIGASDMTLQYYLLPYLEQFHEKFPSVKICVTNAPTPITLENLLEGKIDFGVVSSPFELPKDVEAISVREIEDIFVAGRKFLPYKNRMLDFSELEKMPLICLEKNTSSRSYLENFLEENQVTINPEFELATSEMIVQFAHRNLGVGCVVKDFAEELMETGTLFELRFNKMIPKRQICVVTHKKIPPVVAAGELLDMLIR